MSLKIGVLMGGASSERIVSINTGNAVISACNDLSYLTTKFIFNNNYEKLLDEFKKHDIIFNALHGGIGENGNIQSWFDKHQIKYTGSGPKSSKLCMDKAKSKKIAKVIGVQTPDWELVNNPNTIPNLELPQSHEEDHHHHQNHQEISAPLQVSMAGELHLGQQKISHH